MVTFTVMHTDSYKGGYTDSYKGGYRDGYTRTLTGGGAGGGATAGALGDGGMGRGLLCS